MHEFDDIYTYHIVAKSNDGRSIEMHYFFRPWGTNVGYISIRSLKKNMKDSL